MATINAPPPSPIQGAAKEVVSYMIKQSDEQVQPNIDSLLCTPLQNSWTLCCLPIPKTETESDIWDQIQLAPGIYAAGISTNGKFNEVAVDASYMPWLFRHHFELILNYDPTEPAAGDVIYHGICEARTIANTHFLEIAAKACRSGPRELRLCFLETAQLHGVKIELEWAILNQDILESSQVREKFTKNLVIFALNLIQVYNTIPALELLSKCQEELLCLVVNQSKNKPKRPSLDEMQMISLVRLLFEFSGGREDIEQHKFDKDFTATENANLFRDLLGITGSHFFGRFNAQNMLDALSTSRIFTENDLRTIDIVELSSQMTDFIPVGYRQGHLDLPDLVLHRLRKGSVNEIGLHIEHFYHRHPSLRISENNVLLLITWSSATAGHPVEILSEWAASEDGLNLYQRSIRDIQTNYPIEQLKLTLAALVCHKRLLPYSPTDSTQPIGVSYLLDFDTLVKGKSLSNERAVLDRMGFSLLRVLETFTDGFQHTFEPFATVLKTPILHRFDGFSDEYWVYRVRGLPHEEAFKKTNIHEVVDDIVMVDVDDEEDWKMVVRSS